MKITFPPLAAIVFVVVVLCWFTFAGIFIFRKQPRNAQDRKRDRSSIVGVALQGLSYAMVWTVRRQPFTPLVPERQWFEVLTATIAIVAAIGSVLLIVSAVKTLGKEWSITARMVQDHKLATRGPYAHVRHPIYTGMLGMLVATGLAISHWIVLVAAIVVFAIGTWIRVRIEERLLRETFGPQFEEYARRVPAVIPRIF
jgi:protein-S-isoprenylcysteine O-methyltransferase Ste14